METSRLYRKKGTCLCVLNGCLYVCPDERGLPGRKKPHVHRKALLKRPEDAQQIALLLGSRGSFPFQRSFTPIYVFLADSHKHSLRQLSNRVESVEGQVKKILVNMLSPRKPKRPARSLTTLYSRDAKERELMSVTWWPLTQRWRVTRNRGSGRQDA